MTRLDRLPLHLAALRRAYSGGGVKAADVVREVYRRIRAVGTQPIWITLRPEEQVVAEAERLRDPGTQALFGVPFAVKDNFDVAGLPTTAGCPAFAYMPARSATVVDRLLAAGALLVGKTNLDQFATGLVGPRSPYGVCRSVLDPELISGGSSSGSAVAVASGLISFALGTDTAGSGRVPAAMNNLIGLKPTRGILSTAGVVLACRSLDCVSIFALTAPDAQTVLEVGVATDPRDPYSRPFTPADARSSTPALGYLEDLSLLEPVFHPVYRGCVERWQTLGHSCRPIDATPFLRAAKLLYEGAYLAERYAAVGAFIEANPGAVHPVVRDIILGGRRFSAAEAFRDHYALEALRKETVTVWTEVEALVLPTVPAAYRVIEVLADPVRLNSRLGTFTNFVNLLDLSALALPTPRPAGDPPFGVTLVGPAQADGLLLALGDKYLRATQPPLGGTANPYPQDGRTLELSVTPTVRLAVVGAHLSGFPLNGQLTSRGATCVGPFETAPAYRLFALPGGPVPKPGLVRYGPGQGKPIAVEVWELSPAAFGSFVNEVPPPLAIGSVELAGGVWVKGFLCESWATAEATDVTEYGGWRAYHQALGEGVAPAPRR